jgi:hypothetical protein
MRNLQLAVLAVRLASTLLHAHTTVLLILSTGSEQSISFCKCIVQKAVSLNIRVAHTSVLSSTVTEPGLIAV